MTYTKEVQSPRGVTVTLHAREDTSDLSTIGSTFRLWDKLVDEYGLADIHSDGLLVDVGAHIGTVAIAFLLDNPKAQAVAVEPLPENVDLIRLNAESAGVKDRLTIYDRTIGDPVVHYGFDDHRYIGNIGGSTANTAIKVPSISLSSIALAHGPIDVLKVDCEGCEWSAFADPVVSRVRLIIGEYHQAGPAGLSVLRDTHDVTSDSGSTGNFRAVLRMTTKPMIISQRTRADAEAIAKAVPTRLGSHDVIRVLSPIRKVGTRWEFDVEVAS